MKKIIYIVVLVLIAIVVVLYLNRHNFSKKGDLIIHDASVPAQVVLVKINYTNGGLRQRSKRGSYLIFNDQSLCVTETTSVSCVSMGEIPAALFEESYVLVEGTTQPDHTVLVKRITKLD